MKKILIIEDDKFIIEPMEIIFKRSGFDVDIATDGQSGLELAKKNNPDIILLDIILPKMNGFDVLKKIRSDKKISEIPVVIVSNLAEEKDIKKGMQLGAFFYVVKSRLDVRELVKKVNKLLELN